jgi:RNA polymerase-binding transcription factor DksA
MPANPSGRYPPAGSLPYWRAMLEARWQAQLVQLTELSLEFHEAAAAVHGAAAGDATLARDGATARHSGAPGGDAVRGQRRLRALGRRTVAARRALADIDEALARVKPGRFGRCEQCADAIPLAILTRTPEARFCPACVSALDRCGAALLRAPARGRPGRPVLSRAARPGRAGTRRTGPAGRPGSPPGPAAGPPARSGGWPGPRLASAAAPAG